VENGIVYVKEPDNWLPTKIPVEFVKDFELNDTLETEGA
jgi:hypothetical protein